MEELWISLAAGAGGGSVVVVGERFLFSAPSAWHGVKKSLRFYREQYWDWRGKSVVSCPVCWCPDPNGVQDPRLLPEGWQDPPRGVKWLRCRDCSHVWGIQEVVTGFFPVDDERDAAE